MKTKHKELKLDDLLKQTIGIKEPWYIDKIELNEKSGEVHVFIKGRKTAKYRCPKCHNICSYFDEDKVEKIWRHADICFYPCYVHCYLPIIRCGEEFYTLPAPWASPDSKYTHLYESYDLIMSKYKKKQRKEW